MSELAFFQVYVFDPPGAALPALHVYTPEVLEATAAAGWPRTVTASRATAVVVAERRRVSRGTGAFSTVHPGLTRVDRRFSAGGFFGTPARAPRTRLAPK